MEEISLEKMSSCQQLKELLLGSKIPTEMIDEEFFLILKEEQDFFNKNKEDQLQTLVT